MIEHDPADVIKRHESEVRIYCRKFAAVFTRARGVHLWDDRGERYVDLLCGSGSLNYGHNPPQIVDRVVRYLTDDGLVHSLDLYSTAKSDFLRAFVTTVLEPRGLGDHRVQFPGPAGTLAVEAALKLARKVTGRSEVIAFRGGFHGGSLGALAITTSPFLRAAAGTVLPHATFLPFGDESPREALEQLRATATTIRPAAIALETVLGEGGLRTADPRWLAGVREVADEVGALVVVDDIQAGCGRTGTFFSFEHVPELAPDLVCLSKSLSGLGLPIAALLIRPEHDQWRPGEHNGTFRGNNLAFVGATAAIEHWWADPGFTDRTTALGAAIGTTLGEIARDCRDGSVEVVGRGTMRGLRFADVATAGRVQEELFRFRVIAEIAGQGRVLKLLPPLTMSPQDWDEIVATLGDVVRRCTGRAAVSHAGG